MRLIAQLQDKLAALDDDHRRRRCPVLDSPQGPHVRIDGRDYLAFASNDYLGLANHPALVAAARDGALRWGVGGGASHLVAGHSAAHAALEQALADWLRLPAALLFSSGYQANLAVITALVGRGDAVFADRLNHASLNDACLLSRAEFKRFAHHDLAQLERLLAASTAPTKLIAVDAVYSMDGDCAPLAALLALAERFDAWLYVDDAHGFGVLGERGRGVLEHFGLCSERLILVGTLGKAAGLAGAFVVAHATIAQYLLQAARTYIFTTASLPAVAHALCTSLALIEGAEGQARRQQLQALQARLRAGVQALMARRPDLGWRLADSDTPVQPLIVGDNAAVMALAARLDAAGLRVPGIRPPTVPEGEARLRITLCASHTEADVDALLHALQNTLTSDLETATP